LLSANQLIQLPILEEKKIILVVKREDLLHPFISGNKWRKIKYNILAAKKSKKQSMLTFGGAYSNHIAAVAAAGKLHNFITTGVIRGEELKDSWQKNPTLAFARGQGMRFKFVTRAAYKLKETHFFLQELEAEFGNCYLIPEGGTNALAIKGCEEILNAKDSDFDYISTCVGTGGTITGIINSSNKYQKVLGFAALKGDFLEQDIAKLTTRTNWNINSTYHFGGYGKITEELIHFINNFRKTTGIPLDPIYTGKMLYGLLEMIKNDNFAPHTKILAIHTGGLQGIAGMNLRLEKNKSPLLDI